MGMTIQVFKDGDLQWTLEHNSSQIDLVVIPRALMNDCSISLEAFDELYFNELKKSTSNSEAYERAEVIHQQFFFRRKFKNYETYASTKSRKLNR